MFPYQTNPRLKDKNSRAVARLMSYQSYTCRKKATRLHPGKSGDIFYRIRKTTKILVQLVNCYVQHEVHDTTNISPERLQKCRSGHEWEANPSAEDPRKGSVFLGWTPGAETGEEGKNHNGSRFVRWLQEQQPAEGRYRVCKPLFDVKLRDWPIRLRLILCHVPPFAFLIWPCTHFIRYRGEPQIRHFPANAVVPACQWNLCGKKGSVEKKSCPGRSANILQRRSKEIGKHEIWPFGQFRPLMRLCTPSPRKIFIISALRCVHLLAVREEGSEVSRRNYNDASLFIRNALDVLLSTRSRDDFEASSRPLFYYYRVLSTKERITTRSRVRTRRWNVERGREPTMKLGRRTRKWDVKGDVENIRNVPWLGRKSNLVMNGSD